MLPANDHCFARTNTHYGRVPFPRIRLATRVVRLDFQGITLAALPNRRTRRLLSKTAIRYRADVEKMPSAVTRGQSVALRSGEILIEFRQ